jgi:anhydro-N-acetylmuramic acid kinase
MSERVKSEHLKNDAMIVAGVMSGTSADGINVALVRIKPGTSHKLATAPEAYPEIQLIGHVEYPYPADVRAAILAAMNAEQARVADLARLNFLLGELYADAVLKTARRFRQRIHLVGCHGQTLYHQGEAQEFLGKKVVTTWQTGEAAIIAARVGVPVVSDFRPADMAAGGKGAPLVPYLDYLFFRDTNAGSKATGRIVQNVGGIANLTAIPANAAAKDIFAFDTGPGNMVIDAVTETLFGQRFDEGGKIAAGGDVIEPVVKNVLAGSFFRAKPPKTAGREEFGREFVQEFLRECRGAPKHDIVATATALTAQSIADAVERFVIGKSNAAARQNYREMIVSGGGAQNKTLMKMLSVSLAAFGIQLRFTDEFGLPTQAKEAVAFAVMAYETWNRRPSNVPSATGARRPAILGKISYV